MPVMECSEGGKPGFKYGESGHCYVYTPGDEASRERARAQAERQGRAIEANRHSGKAMHFRKEFEVRHLPTSVEESDLEIINKRFALEPVTKEQVFVGTMLLADTRLDRSLERFSLPVLERFATTLAGKPVLVNHDRERQPVGRFLSGTVQRASDGEHELYARYFLDADDPLTRRVKTGISKDVSISGSYDQRLCDLCEKDYDRPGKEQCKHQVGRDYDGVQCTLTYAGDPARYETHEGSFVAIGCQPAAQTVSAGLMKSLLPGSALILDPPSPDPEPVTTDKDTSMTIEEAQAKITALEKELADLKGQQPDPLIDVGKAYCADLKQEILKTAKSVDEQTLADYEAFFSELENPSLDTLKKWREGVQKRFDAKFPPQAKGQQRPEEGVQKQIAARPTLGGRW